MRSPLRDPVFRRLALAYSVNELGNWLGDVALAVVVYDRTRSALATAALFLAARFVPAALAPIVVARLEGGGGRRALASVYLEASAHLAEEAARAEKKIDPALLNDRRRLAPDELGPARAETAIPRARTWSCRARSSSPLVHCPERPRRCRPRGSAL